MTYRAAIAFVSLLGYASAAHAFLPGKTPTGADRHWSSGTIAVQLTGPSEVDGNAVLAAVQNAMNTWNATPTSIRLTPAAAIARTEPVIGNHSNEFGWVESTDSPYFLPGVPCVTAYIYDTATGVMDEADTTCNAAYYQWPDTMFGNYTQNNVADAETVALAAFGTWLGLDASPLFGDTMYPDFGPGYVSRSLTQDVQSFARHRYNGTESNGTITGTVRFQDGTPIPFAYVLAFSEGEAHGGVADASGAYSLFELPAGSYYVRAQPLTTDPGIISSLPYRSNPIENLDFTPRYYGAPSTAPAVANGTTTGVDITISQSGTDADVYEPNPSPATGAGLTVGYSYLATHNAVGDVDWFHFTSSANTCYVVQTPDAGASIAPTGSSDTFWSRTRLSLYSGSILLALNDSKDDRSGDPTSWVTYCEGGSSRRLDLKVEQRAAVGGPGYFYDVEVIPLTSGTSLTPSIAQLYPASGWENRQRFVWIDGANFMPGATVDVLLPGGIWASAIDVIATQCDGQFRCTALKALFPNASPGFADVRVPNPNGLPTTKARAFEYLPYAYGPVSDWTPSAFGTRFGSGQAVCIGDFDGDGAEDIFKTRSAGLPYQLFRNNRNGTFSNVASAVGIHQYSSVVGSSCSWIDVDDDGDLDLYVSNYGYILTNGSANELYLNRLSDSGTPGLQLATPAPLQGDYNRYKADAAWADFNKDGRIDVVVAYDSYAGPQPYYEAVQYFTQNADGTFSNTTTRSGLGSYFATVTSVKAADFDGDGCDDLVFFTHGGTANRLYRGQCDGSFHDDTARSHIGDFYNDWPWCTGVAVADFNNDGKLDILCGTYNVGAGKIRPRLWINDGNAVFTDFAASSGLYGVARNMDVVLSMDEDNDGYIDAYLGNSDNGYVDDSKDVLLHNNGTSPPSFTDITDAAGMYPTTQDGSGLCIAGVDEYYCDRNAAAGGVFDWFDDGALDAFVTGTDPYLGDLRGADFLWRNQRYVIRDGTVPPANDWIQIALKGGNTRRSRALSNSFGVGAKVTVIPSFNLPGGAVPTEAQCLQGPLLAGAASFTREALAGNQSQSSTVLHFGLQQLPYGRKIVDCVRVSWPSGLEIAYTGLTANSKVVLAEDVGRIRVVRVIPNTGANNVSNTITISGLHFERDLDTVPSVSFGLIPASTVTFISDHELSVTTPAGQVPGTVDVTVTNPSGVSDTLPAGYTFSGSPSSQIRFKDPASDMLTTTGTIPNDPGFVAQRGRDRIGAMADGVTRLVLEFEVGAAGTVRFALDDDVNPDNAPPPALGVGSMTSLAGGPPQTAVTVTASLVGSRWLAHAVYLVPQDFIRSAADEPLARRPVWVRATYTSSSGAHYPTVSESFDLYRVAVLYMGGMWSDLGTFGWSIVNDPRWITRRDSYDATNTKSFADNIGTPAEAIRQLRKKVNDLGVAGTRFFVFAQSMGGVLFKIYLSGRGAPYARADNFFAGDVYALVSVDSPFAGSSLASYTNAIARIPVIGGKFADIMRGRGLPVDEGCMQSLDPQGQDTLNIGSATGTFHAMAGWGGKEMRAAGVNVLEGSKIKSLAIALKLFNRTFDSYLLNCGTGQGDDFVVCTNSQLGGLTGSVTSQFHYRSLAEMAIHFDSICKEPLPGAEAERLLNTPTSDATTWAATLPSTSQMSGGTGIAQADSAQIELHESAAASQPGTGDGAGVHLDLAKQAKNLVLSCVGSASRLLKSISPTLAAGVCLSVSGSSYLEADALVTSIPTYYAAGTATLCDPADGASIASVSPATGSMMGGYAVTILGSGFDAGTRVMIGDFYISRVIVVNGTTLTFKMMSGAPGPATITVKNGAGQSASATFTYTDPGPVAGGVVITAPAPGSTVTSGATLSVAAVGTGGFKIAGAAAYSKVFSTDVDLDGGPGFNAQVSVPPNYIGPLTVGLLAKDAAGNVLEATPVSITVEVPASVSLQGLRAEQVNLLWGSPTAQLHVYGDYSDGIEREVTEAAGIVYVVDRPDPTKPDYPHNGSAIAEVSSTGLVTAGTFGTTVCHVAYQSKALDVILDVAGVRTKLLPMKLGGVGWAYQGPGITYDVVRGSLSTLRSTGGNFALALDTTWGKCKLSTFTAADAAIPATGNGYFYLMRTSRERSYEESPYWATRSQVGQRTAEIDATGFCP